MILWKLWPRILNMQTGYKIDYIHQEIGSWIQVSDGFWHNWFRFFCGSNTVKSKEVLTRLWFLQFSGMESNTRLIKVFFSHLNTFRAVWRPYFRKYKITALPGVEALLGAIDKHDEKDVTCIQIKTPPEVLVSEWWYFLSKPLTLYELYSLQDMPLAVQLNSSCCEDGTRVAACRQWPSTSTSVQTFSTFLGSEDSVGQNESIYQTNTPFHTIVESKTTIGNRKNHDHRRHRSG